MGEIPRLDAYHFYEQEWDDIEQLRESFEWQCPDEFNIASYACDRWATGEGRVAVYAEDGEGRREEVTYDEIQRRANRLANFLAEQGVSRGDRVGICLPQSPEVVVGNVAAWKLGAISVPLSTLFGPDAMGYRLGDCGVTACLAGSSTADVIREVADDLPDLETLVLVDGPVRDDEVAYDRVQDDYSADFETVTTDPEDEACIIYTSGTTGDPKGVVHVHRFVLGMLPLMARTMLKDRTPAGQVWWTPVGWSWIGSLNNVLSGLFYGVSLVAYDGGKFDPEKAFEVLDRYDVTFFGGPPTMLRMMMNVENASDRFDVGDLWLIGSGGEALEESTVEWVDETFDGATVQEAYGQTESGLNVGDYYPLVPVRREKIGVEMPGNEVAIVDEQTAEPTVPTGEIGEIAVKFEDNLGVFKEYWNLPEKTEAKIQNGWLLTEDLGTIDEDGYFSFETRADDIIISSGYKVSPEEIEETLIDHPAVAASGVIGVPHDERGEIPKAFVSLADGTDPSADLRVELQEYVKETLAKYEYPRELEFVDALPRTNTGKVSRSDLRSSTGQSNG